MQVEHKGVVSFNEELKGATVYGAVIVCWVSFNEELKDIVGAVCQLNRVLVSFNEELKGVRIR